MKRSPLRPPSELPSAPILPGRAGGGQLASALHEVSNALTVVLGWLDVARERTADDATREALEVARSHARLGFRVARQAVGADIAVEDDERSAAALARSALLAVTPRAGQRGVLLTLDIATGLDDHVADAPAISQILLNLLLNAVAFTDGGKNVSLALREVGGMLSFHVSDEGPGIPADRVERLLESSESSRDGGAGIGLRYSSELAMACGGRLALVRSEPGACFELRWPKSGARSGARQASVDGLRLEGSRILVLEDDPAVLGLIELGLEARGAEVIPAGSRAELERLVSEPLALSAALLDLSPILDEPDGALSALRSAIGQAPIVLITGSASGVPDAVQDVVSAWVRKPFEMSEVVEVLGTLVLGRR